MSDLRAEWLRRRRELVTASDVAAILGVDPRRGPLAVYASKVGTIQDEDAPLLRRGRRLEPIIAAEYAETTGRPVEEPPPYELVTHPDLPPWLAATLDRRTAGVLARPAPADGPAPLELKGVGIGHRDEWETAAPVYVQVQLAIQVACDGAAWGSIAALLGLEAEGPVVYDYLRNDRFIAAALPRLEEFHLRVKRRDPPPETDALPATSRAVRALFGATDGTTVPLDQEAQDLAADWERAKAAGRTAEAEAVELENALRRRLAGATFGALLDGTFLRLNTISRTGYTVAPTTYTVLGRYRPKVRRRA